MVAVPNNKVIWPKKNALTSAATKMGRNSFYIFCHLTRGIHSPSSTYFGVAKWNHTTTKLQPWQVNVISIEYPGYGLLQGIEPTEEVRKKRGSSICSYASFPNTWVFLKIFFKSSVEEFPFEDG